MITFEELNKKYEKQRKKKRLVYWKKFCDDNGVLFVIKIFPYKEYFSKKLFFESGVNIVKDGEPMEIHWYHFSEDACLEDIESFYLELHRKMQLDYYEVF